MSDDTDLVNMDETLNELLESASASTTPDEAHIFAHIKLVLDTCVKRGGGGHTPRSDQSARVLDLLVKSYSNIAYAHKLSEHIAKHLDKVTGFLLLSTIAANSYLRSRLLTLRFVDIIVIGDLLGNYFNKLGWLSIELISMKTY